MMKKKVLLTGWIIFCVSVFIALSGCSLMKYKKKIASTEIEKINLESIKDGEYEGFYDVYYLNARVAVKVEDNKIVSIELIEHKYDRYSGEPMIQQVLDNQSLDVDAISGATNSCKTVLKAIEIALSKGKI
ncbi:conserved exported hypothetical protein [Desulfamplus magnetovallimortis]|uniref:FMN-binding domain-containing protein n=2 Tax=Desulfamplus magnetovallimortis TaxID=1246637 RepID=A0A1W1HIU3_9BACT|nr:conserved exported hypothetical protein [Desulfamplus magnetovallimortis]